MDAGTNCPIDYCAKKQQAAHFAGDSLLNMGKMCSALKIDVKRWDAASYARNKVSDGKFCIFEHGTHTYALRTHSPHHTFFEVVRDAIPLSAHTRTCHLFTQFV